MYAQSFVIHQIGSKETAERTGQCKGFVLLSSDTYDRGKDQRSHQHGNKPQEALAITCQVKASHRISRAPATDLHPRKEETEKDDDGRAGISLTQELHHSQAIRIQFYIEPFGSDSSGPLSPNDSKFTNK